MRRRCKFRSRRAEVIERNIEVVRGAGNVNMKGEDIEEITFPGDRFAVG